MEPYITRIITGSETESVEALKKFVEEASELFSFPELDQNNQRQQLWDVLFKLASTSEDCSVRKNCFIAIRILSREKSGLNELITPEWLTLIQTHSGLSDPNFEFTTENQDVALEVLKCSFNLIFNSFVVAKLCCKSDFLKHLVERLKTCDHTSYDYKHVPEEVKFFYVKLVFLLTALRSEVRNSVRVDMDGVTSLIRMLDAILKKSAEKGAPDNYNLSDENADLVCEILKALFNLTLNCYGNCNDKKEDEQCEHLVILLRTFLLIQIQNKEKANAVKSNVVNLLTNIPETYYQFLVTPINPEENISNKCQFEGHNMSAFNEILTFCHDLASSKEKGVSKQYEIICPVLTVLLKSANSERNIRKYLRSQILPPLKDVHTRPEQGSTLRNQLCRLLTTPITQLRDIVADLLFVLCKKNARRMIKYTGYGNAAGLLAQRGLLGGKSDQGEADYSSDSEDSETEEYAEYKHGINPVVGCYEEPRPNAMENMTEEQKEYEAMKLVELMDSLTKCGAIKPCRVGADGKPHPIEHVLQLQEGLRAQQIHNDSDSD